MPKFNHAFDFAFEVITDADVSDVTPATLRSALLERVNRLSDAELYEACDCFDSSEIEENESDWRFPWGIGAADEDN